MTAVAVEGDHVRVRVDDTSDGGTDDVTLETVLVRVDGGAGPAPEEAVVVDETGTATRSDR